MEVLQNLHNQIQKINVKISQLSTKIYTLPDNCKLKYKVQLMDQINKVNNSLLSINKDLQANRKNIQQNSAYLDNLDQNIQQLKDSIKQIKNFINQMKLRINSIQEQHRQKLNKRTNQHSQIYITVVAAIIIALIMWICNNIWSAIQTHKYCKNNNNIQLKEQKK